LVFGPEPAGALAACVELADGASAGPVEIAEDGPDAHIVEAELLVATCGGPPGGPIVKAHLLLRIGLLDASSGPIVVLSVR
jgi:hypothetical protein